MAGLSVGRAAWICVLACVLVYHNSLGLRFCFDDEIAIVQNMDLRPNTSWSDLLQHDFWGKPMSSPDSHKSYRPLTVATFRLNYMLHELQPLGYHLVNVLLHGAVCYLYVLLCGVVFSEVWPALIAGLLFAVHPIHTEVVSGIVARADALSALFFLAAIFCYRRTISSNITSHKYGGLMLTLLLVLCSALSKETGITAVALCLAYELLIHRQFNFGDVYQSIKSFKKSFKLPSWFVNIMISGLLFGVFVIIFIAVRLQLNQGPPSLHYREVNPAFHFSTPYRQLHWSYLCVLNLWLLLSPSQLCAEYAMDTIPPISSLTDPRNLLTLATFAALVSMLCYGMSGREGQRRKVLFALCVVVIPFIPASNLFFPVGFVIAERVLYIPSMGFCMLVSYGIWSIASKTSYDKIAKIGVQVLLIMYGLKTYTRNKDWYDNHTLFTSALKTGTRDSILLNNLAVTAEKDGNTDLAIAVLRHAMEISPLHTPSYFNVAKLLKDHDRMDEAIEIYWQAEKLVSRSLAGEDIPLYPNNTRVYIQLANMLLKHTNRYQEAHEMSRKAVKLEPKWEDAYNMEGSCLFKLGQYSEAKAAFQKAVQLNPEYIRAHSNLGEVCTELGELVDAEHHLREAVRLGSSDFLTKFRLVKLILDHSSTHTRERLMEGLHMAQELYAVETENGNLTVTLALFHDRLGEHSMAADYLEQSIDINPDHAPTYIALSRTYSTLKRHAEAIDVLTQYLKMVPNDTTALSQLGTTYLAMKEYDKAQPYLIAAMERDPDNEAALVNYGLLLMYTQEYVKALEIFRSVQKQYPENPSYAKQVQILEEGLAKTRNQTPSQEDT